MNVPSFVSHDAARRRRIGIAGVLAAVAVAIALAATLQHRPSHARDASEQPLAFAGVAPGAGGFVDVSLPAASKVFAHHATAADDDCPTF